MIDVETVNTPFEDRGGRFELVDMLRSILRLYLGNLFETLVGYSCSCFRISIMALRADLALANL
jgi:hypothetical protein